MVTKRKMNVTFLYCHNEALDETHSASIITDYRETNDVLTYKREFISRIDVDELPCVSH